MNTLRTRKKLEKPIFRVLNLQAFFGIFFQIFYFASLGTFRLLFYRASPYKAQRPAQNKVGPKGRGREGARGRVADGRAKSSSGRAQGGCQGGRAQGGCVSEEFVLEVAGALYSSVEGGDTVDPLGRRHLDRRQHGQCAPAVSWRFPRCRRCWRPSWKPLHAAGTASARTRSCRRSGRAAGADRKDGQTYQRAT